MGSCLGHYEPKERQDEMVRTFEANAKIKEQERRAKFAGTKGTIEEKKVEVKKPEPPKDPLKEKCEKILREIEILGKEAAAYNDQHVNQEYRRINADCVQLQMELDRLDVTGRDDCRKLRKCGIIKAEEAAELLSSKIHPDGSTNPQNKCSICLKL